MDHNHWLSVNEPVWVHKNQKFHKAIVKEIYKDIVTCMLENTDNIKSKKSEIFQRNPMPQDSNRTDLMETDLINQPEVLLVLKLRFENKKIYTFVENTLIAVNPYKMIDGLYTDDIRSFYVHNLIEKNQNMKDHEPHIYSIVGSMLSALKSEQKSQAIVISGQSGAGKTQANKECLRFLGNYFKKLHGNQQSKIQKAILQSNPILQAFGNSKTIRNNNSSRFGKYLSILVDEGNNIRHAQIFNYLLQKSRIISRPSQQQNFHIFYEFLSKTSKAEKFKYALLSENNKQLTFMDFKYTKNTANSHYFSHPDVSFQKVRDSLVILPDPQSYDYMCRILSAILHLGNIEPYEDDTLDVCDIIPENSFTTICNLLQIKQNFLKDALTSYNIKIGNQDLIKSFPKREVQELIYSLSKTLYEKLFQWIINQINLSTASEHTGEMLSIGFLDIYGFQVLKENSLEQIFINYTNERLHQIYLTKIFKLQQEVFASQNLSHKFRKIDFQDNLKVIELLDYHHLSVLNLLDQWCSIASPDQSNFISKLRFNHKKNENFPPQNFNLISTQFMIKHTPENVVYNVTGFRQKNKDLLREEIKMVMGASKLKILEQMFNESNMMATVTHKERKFLSSKFRKQMNNLTNDILSQCNLHFIRCIKSNTKKAPLMLQQEIVYSQIKYLGILDTIKIKKMGYCIKVKYENIDQRFSWVVRDHFMEAAFSTEIKKNLFAFLNNFSEAEMIFGTNKVFFRDFAYSVLVRKYAHHMAYLNEMAHRLTNLFVHNLYRKKKLRKLAHIATMNRFAKGFGVYWGYRQKTKKIRLVQKKIREFLLKRAIQKKEENIEIIQVYIKRNIAVKQRLYKMHCLQKIIRFMRRVVIKKKAQKFLIANHAIKNVIFEKVWATVTNDRIQLIKQYILSFKIQIKKKDKISIATIKERLAVKNKAVSKMKQYIVGFRERLYYHRYLNTVVKGQNLIKSWMVRRRYLKLRKAAIVIQRAWRDYLFKKNGARKMFNQVYQYYEKQLLDQNISCQNQLYDSETSRSQQLTNAINLYLNKFREKINLMYWIVDFEAFVDLSIVYPNNSWIQNYIQIYKESLEKDNPIQYMDIGETFTVISNTNKAYMWGMYEKYRVDPESLIQIKSKSPIQYYQINKNQLHLNHHSKANKNFAIASNVHKGYNLQNGKIYACLSNELRLIEVGNHERVVEIACGKAHTVLRTFSKKVYTFGVGKDGQLGHSTFNYEEQPKIIKFFDQIKTSHPIQVGTSFNSTIVLMSNKKIYWFGTNGTIKNENKPIQLQLKSKSLTFGTSEFAPIRILPSWSRTMSVIGLTIVCYNGRFSNNVALKNKTTDIIINKWQQLGLHYINPPLAQGVCDHLQQCHVRLPKRKVEIEPQSKKVLKDMQEKIKLMDTDTRIEQISFANTQRNSFFK